MRGTCQTCEHFSALESECRAHSPQLFLMATPKGPQKAGLFPTIDKNSWCGEHKINESKTAAKPHVFSHVNGGV